MNTRRTRFRMPRILTLILAALVPLTVAGVLVGAFASSSDRLDTVPAAVVNNDRLIETTNADGKTEPVFAGRALVTDLTGNRNDAFDWQITNERDAERALAAGEVYAVITIPSDFSERVLSLQSDEPRQAGITITTDAAHDYLSPSVAAQVAQQLVRTFGETVTAGFVSGVYGGFSDVADALTTAANGADELSRGTRDLSNGLGELANGQQQLADGIGSSANGAGSLGDGAIRLAAGADQLSAGLGEYTAGVEQLAGGVRQLSDGVDPLRTALGQLPSYQGEIDGALAQAAELARETLADPDSSEAERAAAEALLKSLGELESGNYLGQATAALGQLVQGIDALESGATQLEASGGALRDGAAGLGDGARQLSDGTATLQNGLAQLQSGTVESRAGTVSAAQGAAGLEAGMTRLGDGLRQGAAELPNLSDDAVERLANVVANPVGYEEQARTNVSDAARVATLAIPVALWLGALAAVMVVAPVTRRMLAGTDSTGTIIRGFVTRLLPLLAAQIALPVLALHAFMGVAWSSIPATLGIVTLIALVVTFAHAVLLTLWRRAGAIISLVLLVVQAVATGGLVPIELVAAPLGALSPAMPLSHGVQGLQAVIAGGALAAGWSAAVALAAMALALLGAYALVIGAARRARTRDLLLSSGAIVSDTQAQERQPTSVAS